MTERATQNKSLTGAHESTRTTCLSAQQLAEITSESVSVWRKRIRLGEISVVRFGRNVRVLARDLESWIEDCRA